MPTPLQVTETEGRGSDLVFSGIDLDGGTSILNDGHVGFVIMNSGGTQVIVRVSVGAKYDEFLEVRPWKRP
jgi:hypothetical protein